MIKPPVATYSLDNPADMDKLIAEMAKELNKIFPQFINNATRIDKIVPEQNNAFSYKITIIEDNELFNSSINKLPDFIKKRILHIGNHETISSGQNKNNFGLLQQFMATFEENNNDSRIL